MFRGKLFKVARLGFDPYEEKFGFAGDQDIGSTVKCATEEEALAEDEAAFETPGQTLMEVPSDLVPAVRELIAAAYGSTSCGFAGAGGSPRRSWR
jgi:hypothetical protein